MDVDDHQNYLQRALISSLSTLGEVVVLDEIVVNREILLDQAVSVELEKIIKSFRCLVIFLAF